jgi:uncharacterized protein (TIGR03086 family)
MSDHRDSFHQQADRFTAVLDGLPSSAWAAPSPCAGWTAADVVDHLVDSQRDFLARQGVDLGPRPDGDPAAVWAAHREAALAVDDEVWHREYDGFFGPTTVGATLADFYGFDLVVHRWDVARAVGRDVRFSEAEMDDAERAIEGFGEHLYAEGICARPVPVPDGADRQTRLLARLGRSSG